MTKRINTSTFVYKKCSFKRFDLFSELKAINTTLIFYETAPRILKTLNVMLDVFKGREIAIAREITKLYEECIRGLPEELISHFSENPPKGEFVIMVAPPSEISCNDVDVEAILRTKLSEMPLKSAVKEIVSEYRLNKNEIYELALKLKDEK